MTDKELLKKALKEKEKTMNDIASLLSISRQALYKKVNGDVEFKTSEIKKISVYLGLSDGDISNIFFN